MKMLVLVGAALTLAACAADGGLRSSANFNGQSIHSMDLADPHFYMDDDRPASPASPGGVPAIPRYGIDGYCGYCQAR